LSIKFVAKVLKIVRATKEITDKSIKIFSILCTFAAKIKQLTMMNIKSL